MYIAFALTSDPPSISPPEKDVGRPVPVGISPFPFSALATPVGLPPSSTFGGGETEKGTSPAASLPSLLHSHPSKGKIWSLSHAHTHTCFLQPRSSRPVRSGKEIRRASLQRFFLKECKRIAQHLHKLSHFPSFLATRPEWVHFLHLYRDSPPLFTLLRGPLRPRGLAASSPPPPPLAFIHPRTQQYRLYSETRAQKVL